MTVAELIECLKALPPDAKVMFADNEYGETDVSRVDTEFLEVARLLPRPHFGGTMTLPQMVTQEWLDGRPADEGWRVLRKPNVAVLS